MSPLMDAGKGSRGARTEGSSGADLGEDQWSSMWTRRHLDQWISAARGAVGSSSTLGTGLGDPLID